jgi:hypothetical protein
MADSLREDWEISVRGFAEARHESDIPSQGCGGWPSMKRSAPIRRTRIRYKPKQHRESWRSGRIRLDGPEMGKLRWAVFQRSQGFCEGLLCDGERIRIRHSTIAEAVGERWTRCMAPIEWDGPKKFILHHIDFRSHGGSDTEANTRAICKNCDSAQHPGIQWSQKETHDLEAQVSRP